MDKQQLMQKFNIPEDKWNTIFNEQLGKFKKRFPKKTEEELNTQALNSMVSRLLRDKITGRRDVQVLLLGQFPTIPFNYFRVREAQKVKKLYTGKEEEFKKLCAEGKILYKERSALFNANAEIVDNFGNVIDENDPYKNDRHIVYGYDSENHLFVGATSQALKDKIIIGKPLTLSIKKSRIQQKFFGATPVNIIDIKENTETISDEELVKTLDKFAEEHKEELVFVRSAVNVKEADISAILAIEGKVFDVNTSNFGTTVDIVLTNEHIIHCRISPHLERSFAKFIDDDIDVKILARTSMATEVEDEANVDVISIWCRPEDISANVIVDNVGTDDKSEEDLKSW